MDIEAIETEYELACKELGMEHPDALTAMYNLSLAYTERPDEESRERACALAGKVFVLRKKVLGEKHGDSLYAAKHLARCYSMLGDFLSSNSLYRELIDLFTEVFGASHPETKSVDMRYWETYAAIID